MLVYGLSWMSTLAGMMNFKLPTDRTFDGESLIPVLEQKALKRERPLTFGIDTLFQDDPTDKWMVRNGDWKVIIDRDNKSKYLYNLKSNRYETPSLIGKKPDIEKQIYDKFLKYKTDIDNDSLAKARDGKSGVMTQGQPGNHNKCNVCHLGLCPPDLMLYTGSGSFRVE